jgi:hypothetical protein
VHAEFVHDVVTREALLSRHAAALLRLAHQLVGDTGGAVEVVLAAAARLPRHGKSDQLDQRAIRLVLPRARSVLRHRSANTVVTPLDELPALTRICAVLAFALDWDPQTIADACRTTPHRVQVCVADALHVQPESAWRELLAAPQWNVQVPADLVVSADRLRRRRRSRRRQLALGVGCVAITVVGATAAVVRILTAPGPLPPAAHEAGLLTWPPRGSLIRDSTLIDRAAAVWAQHGPAHGTVHPLWAGEVGRGRLVVLQAKSSTGPMVAVIGDETDKGGVPRLKVQSIRPLPDVHVPVLAVPYGGNLGLLGLEGGAGAAIVQLLTAPGVDKVVERHFAGSSDRRSPFVTHPVREGMSTPWVDVALGGGVPSTAVTAYRDGQLLYRGILGRRLELTRVDGHIVDPPAVWTGLPRAGTDGDTLTDDFIWWAQTCHGRPTVMQLLWTGQAPGIGSTVRLETYQCGAGRGHAVFLTGVSDGVRVFAVDKVGPPVYGAELVPVVGGPASLVLVGSQDVAAFRVQGRRLPGRVTVVPLRQAAKVDALDHFGHVLNF